MPRYELPLEMGQAMATIFDTNGQGFPVDLRFSAGASAALAVANNAFGRLFSPYAGKVTRVTASAEVNGGSGGWTFDVLKNGTSILPAPIVVPAGTTALQSEVLWGVTVAQDDAITVNCDAVGETAPTGVSITVHLQTQNQ